MAGDLDPTVTRLNLCIPTIVSIMGHLVRSVLTEADGLGGDTHGSQELESSRYKVGYRLVADNTLSDSIADSH